jgi:tetratricopeptide (TPR) repeat protein
MSKNERRVKVWTAFLCFALVLTGCSQGNAAFKRMQAMEEGVSHPTSAADLQAAIKKYQKRAEDVVLAQGQVGVWYKMLGSRYLEEKMYGEALGAYQKAAAYYPDNQNLHYWIGISAGYVAQTLHTYTSAVAMESTERYAYFKMAESAYLRALELDSRYARALYALGVLYVFELEDPALGIPYLERYVAQETRDTSGMFALARAYYETYRFDKALEMYDLILSTPTSPERRAEAEMNKTVVLEAAHG